MSGGLTRRPPVQFPLKNLTRRVLRAVALGPGRYLPGPDRHKVVQAAGLGVVLDVALAVRPDVVRHLFFARIARR